MCHSGVGGDSGLVCHYTVSPDVSEERSDSIFRVNGPVRMDFSETWVTIWQSTRRPSKCYSEYSE